MDHKEDDPPKKLSFLSAVDEHRKYDLLLFSDGLYYNKGRSIEEQLSWYNVADLKSVCLLMSGGCGFKFHPLRHIFKCCSASLENAYPNQHD